MDTIIRGAFIFDGKQALSIRDIGIENGRLREVSGGERAGLEIDGTGCTLLPGLIDSHVHVYDRPDFLQMAADRGVTTLCDMGCRDAGTVERMKARSDLASVLSSFSPCFAPGSGMEDRMDYHGPLQPDTPKEAREFVRSQLLLGADYIKLILEDSQRNGGTDFPLEIGKAVADEAHKNSRRTIAHAVTAKSFEDGMEMGVDVLTHMPFEAPMPQKVIDKAARSRTVLVPTLVMMKAICDKILALRPQAPCSLQNALDSVRRFHQAGVPILAGTDANLDDPFPPASVPYGAGLLDELELLSQCGLDNRQVLESATSAPAAFWGLGDRGVIEAGKRADLLLVKGNPLNRLSDLRAAVGVWVMGRQVFPRP